jgi:collagen type VII alpha
MFGLRLRILLIVGVSALTILGLPGLAAGASSSRAAAACHPVELAGRVAAPTFRCGSKTPSLRGPRGPKGDRGPRGHRGFTGARGLTGLTGARGLTGLTGAAGTVGAQGLQGIQGFAGLTGLAGS